MSERVPQLALVAGLEVRQHVELAALVGAVTSAAERDDAIRVVAPAERAGHEVRGVDWPAPADETRSAGELIPLGV